MAPRTMRPVGRREDGDPSPHPPASQPTPCNLSRVVLHASLTHLPTLLSRREFACARCPSRATPLTGRGAARLLYPSRRQKAGTGNRAVCAASRSLTRGIAPRSPRSSTSAVLRTTKACTEEPARRPPAQAFP